MGSVNNLTSVYQTSNAHAPIMSIASNIAPTPVRKPSHDAFEIVPNHGMLVTKIYGQFFPPFITKEAIDYLRGNFSTRNNDVIVATYPKTGTMWTLNIVTQLMKHVYPNMNQNKIEFNTITQAKWIESLVSQEGINSFSKYINDTNSNNSKYCIWQTHSYYKTFPVKSINKNTKLIYVTRNPKDCCVSAFHFYQKEPNIGYKGDFNQFFKMFISGAIIFGSYFDHVNDWYNAYINQKSLNIQILWIYFQDLIIDLESQIIKISDFINDDDRKVLSKDNIQDVYEKCQFNWMKNESKSDKIHLSPMFYRKGKIGDWKNYMSKDQSDTIDNIIYARFYHTNIRYWKQAKENIIKRNHQMSKL